MSALEESAVNVRFFKQGSVEELDSIDQAANLELAVQLVRRRFPDAEFLRCCEHEPDGGCVFIYANEAELTLDETDASNIDAAGGLPETYGRWVGLISSVESEEHVCSRPSSHHL